MQIVITHLTVINISYYVELHLCCSLNRVVLYVDIYLLLITIFNGVVVRMLLLLLLLMELKMSRSAVLVKRQAIMTSLTK